MTSICKICSIFENPKRLKFKIIHLIGFDHALFLLLLNYVKPLMEFNYLFFEGLVEEHSGASRT